MTQNSPFTTTDFDAPLSTSFNGLIDSGFHARYFNPEVICQPHTKVMLTLSGFNQAACQNSLPFGLEWRSLDIDGVYILYRQLGSISFGFCQYETPSPELHDIEIGGQLAGETFSVSIGGQVIASHTDTTGLYFDTSIALKDQWNNSTNPLTTPIAARLVDTNVFQLIAIDEGEPFGGAITINNPGGEATFVHKQVRTQEPPIKTYGEIAIQNSQVISEYKSLDISLLINRLGTPPENKIESLKIHLTQPEPPVVFTGPVPPSSLFFSDPDPNVDFGVSMNNDLECAAASFIASSGGQARATFLGFD